ncbi:10238_t:CDS:2, partial [Gigaspora rosea]
MDPFFDINNDNNDGQGNQGNDFWRQVHQLLQLMAGALTQVIQNNQIQEMNVMTIHTFTRENQDPVAWLKAFCTSIPAEFLYTNAYEPWSTELLTGCQKVGEAVDQYAADMVALFRHVSVAIERAKFSELTLSRNGIM